MAENLDPRSSAKSLFGVMATASEEFSLRDVGAAVSKQLGLSPESNEVAALAGKLHAFVNNSIALRASGLDGADFRTLVISNLTPDAARALDPAQVARLRMEQSQLGVGKPDNPFALGTGKRIPVNGLLAADGDEKQASSLGYARTLGEAVLTHAEKLTQAYAIDQGVRWAAENRDILKLGTPAIDILKQTQLRKDVYEGLTKTGLSSRGSIGVAAMIHEHGGNANEGGKAVADSLKAMDDKGVTDAVNARATLQVPGKNETPQQRQAREAKIPAADQQLESAVGEHTKHHPEHAGHGKKLMKTLGVKLKENDAQAKITAMQVAKKSSDFDAFDSVEPSKLVTGAQPKLSDQKQGDGTKNTQPASKHKQLAPSR